MWKLLNKEIFPWPYLDLWIDIGILEIKTEVMYYSFCELVKAYITLHIRILKRWRFMFRLYAPDRR